MHMTLLSGAHRWSRASRFVARVAVAAATVTLGACNLFETDVTNPNAVVEDALSDPAGANTLVNGLGASLIRAHNQVVGTVGTASDELTWAGSREYWKLLDEGDIADPVNEYVDGQFPYVAEARWMADYTAIKLRAFGTQIRVPADRPRALTYAGMAYLLIGENYEDFIIASDRQANAAPLGEANFLTVFDSSIAYFTQAITAARAISNAEWERNALGLRARARFSKAVVQRFRPARNPGTTASPYLINDAGATADAAAALALMTGAYRFQLASNAQNNGGYFSTGFEITQRLEIRAGSEYVNTNPAATRPLDGLDGIKLTDPVSGAKDPVLARAIDECCRLSTGQFLSITATSSAEMLLILAEAALAAGNTTEFTTHINALRALNGVPPWAGTPSALNILKHGRRMNLFMQGRRLLDHHRFGDKADRWLTTSVAYRKACLNPISYNERLQNPLAPQPAVARAANCQ
jgi:starch-binding outer membrane protein, SusD/RagB family